MKDYTEKLTQEELNEFAEIVSNELDKIDEIPPAVEFIDLADIDIDVDLLDILF